MTCLEIITLRFATKLEKRTIRDLVKQMGTVNRAECPVGLKVYRNPAIGNDISVHIQRKASNGDPGKSALGLQVARLFSEYGLVSHSVWIEE